MSTTEASTPPPTSERPALDLVPRPGKPVPYRITPAGYRALAQEPSTDIPREPVRRRTCGKTAA